MHKKLLFFIKIITLTLLLFIKLNIFCEGFIAGTLVKTPKGYVPIEQLKKNDLVISYDFKKATAVEDTIVGIKQDKVNKVIQLTVKNLVLEVDPNHKFYCPMIKGNWVKAKDLPLNHFLLKDATELVRIDGIKEVEKETEVYTLSIKNNHNFFISDQNILVHNIIIFTYIIGEGLVWAGAGELAAYALALAIAFVAKKNGVDTSNFHPCSIKPPTDNDMKHYFNGDNGKKHGFNGKDPKKIWELAELAVVSGCKCNKEIKDGAVQTYQIAVNAYETLEVKGVFVKDAFNVGTLYIKEAYEAWKNSL